jgi:hypothetical protein
VSRLLRAMIAIGLLLIGSMPMAPRATAQTIQVARRAWHIDIGFAVADLGAPLDSVAEQFPGATYLFFGFGDRHYLLGKSRNASVMLGALWPGPGIILVTALKSSPARAFGSAHVIELEVSSAQARAAQAFIWSSLANGGGLAADSTIAPYAQGPYDGSLYFSAIPRYSALHTCNTWAAEALKAGGLRVRSRAVVFAGQVWSQTKKLAAGGAPAADAPQASVPP